MSEEARKKIKRTIHRGLESRENPHKTLRKVYKIIDKDEEWEDDDYEEEDDEECCGEEEEEEEEEEGGGEEGGEEGGFLEALFDLLPDDEDE